jgi:hypothetical protein
MSAPARADRDPWRDKEGTPIPMGAVVEQTGVDLQLGAHAETTRCPTFQDHFAAVCAR